MPKVKLRRGTPEQLNVFAETTGIKAAFVNDVKWMAIKPEHLFSMTLGEIFDGKFRLILEMVVEGTKLFIVSCEEDYNATRVKYPKVPIVNFKQLLGYFKKTIESQSHENPMTDSQLMIAMTVFPEATVVQ